ncbi:MAG: dihydrodipicolinate synthase family protein, partial [Pseudomonadota bacterium]
MRFEGIITPVVTPHDADHEIDMDRFADVLEFLIDSGVHGLLIAGTTGEYYVQSPEERRALMRRAVEVVAGRLPVIVGTGAMRTDDSIAYAEAAKQAGA